MNQSPSLPKILVAPLDWGLGHATRCIPIIRQLLADNCRVFIAASGKTKKLLETEFPQVDFLDLPGYNIRYASTGWGLALKIVAQIPKVLSAIKAEHKWLKRVVRELNLDAVISDNRYGLHYAEIPSVFITHQLLIKASTALAEKAVQQLNYNYIEKFDECWVADSAGEANLAGMLSHPPTLPQTHVDYLGTLSRFEKSVDENKGQHILIVLSGPEPQRSLLERLVLQELDEYSGRVILVRGLPGNTQQLLVNSNVAVCNHLPAADLEQVMIDASFVISRCGYSTVMDLSVLKKKSILIPTPGQTEQEYLAQHLMKKNFALCISQKKFRLKQALELAQSFNYQFAEQAQNNLQTVIKNLLKKINSNNQRKSA